MVWLVPRLGMKVEEVNVNQGQALEMLNAGEIAGIFGSMWCRSGCRRCRSGLGRNLLRVAPPLHAAWPKR
jgi:hypothetical protein